MSTDIMVHMHQPPVLKEGARMHDCAGDDEEDSFQEWSPATAASSTDGCTSPVPPLSLGSSSSSESATSDMGGDGSQDRYPLYRKGQGRRPRNEQIAWTETEELELIRMRDEDRLEFEEIAPKLSQKFSRWRTIKACSAKYAKLAAKKRDRIAQQKNIDTKSRLRRASSNASEGSIEFIDETAALTATSDLLAPVQEASVAVPAAAVAQPAPTPVPAPVPIAIVAPTPTPITSIAPTVAPAPKDFVVADKVERTGTKILLHVKKRSREPQHGTAAAHSERLVEQFPAPSTQSSSLGAPAPKRRRIQSQQDDAAPSVADVYARVPYIDVFIVQRNSLNRSIMGAPVHIELPADTTFEELFSLLEAGIRSLGKHMESFSQRVRACRRFAFLPNERQEMYCVDEWTWQQCKIQAGPGMKSISNSGTPGRGLTMFFDL